jgi:hypothetical protein
VKCRRALSGIPPWDDEVWPADRPDVTGGDADHLKGAPFTRMMRPYHRMAMEVFNQNWWAEDDDCGPDGMSSAGWIPRPLDILNPSRAKEFPVTAIAGPTVAVEASTNAPLKPAPGGDVRHRGLSSARNPRTHLGCRASRIFSNQIACARAEYEKAIGAAQPLGPATASPAHTPNRKAAVIPRPAAKRTTRRTA